jgi:S-adenosylmethionine:tRNA ribosyltransferase-isomerase
MKVSDFDYELPPERIAQSPIEPRDDARLMVVRRQSGGIEHRRFRDLPNLLLKGDLMIANDSRVMAARIHGRKEVSGGKVEALLLREEGDSRSWACLLRGRVREGTRLCFEAQGAETLKAEVVAIEDSGRRILRFERSPRPFLTRYGETPLPPYIQTRLGDPERYQTVYAQQEGSAAAPTAGLHFTPRSLKDLEAVGIGWSTVTLHVGLDTFRPVEVDRTEEHVMHREWVEVPPNAARAIDASRHAGGRVIAVGTTSARVLESAARWSLDASPASAASAAQPVIGAAEGWTDLFLTPGERFYAIDGLLTNFHLPRSTLLMMVSALAGTDLIQEAYRQAIEEEYRFYSFGDAMLIV